MASREVVRFENRTLTRAAGQFVDASIAPLTRSAYASDWATFAQWCESNEFTALPAADTTVANYLAATADSLRPSTLARRVAAINKVHRLHEMPVPGASPMVGSVLAGIRRSRGTHPRRMAPLMLDDLRATLVQLQTAQYPAGVAARRDACLLIFGFAGAFRRSELAALRISDIRPHPVDGLHLNVARSKTDQEGEGSVKALPFGQSPLTCPACAHVRWLAVLDGGDRAGILRTLSRSTEGHVCRVPPETGLLDSSPMFPPVDRHGRIWQDRFLSGQAVHAVVQRRLAAAGIGPSGYGSHSLRAGFVTQALRAGASDRQVMRQTGHRSAATIAVYDRENNPLKGNAVTRLGL